MQSLQGHKNFNSDHTAQKCTKYAKTSYKSVGSIYDSPNYTHWENFLQKCRKYDLENFLHITDVLLKYK